MDIVHYKAVYIAAILATGLLGGLTPLLLGATTQRERLFSLGNAFGGGVFFGAALIHLLPDAIDNYSDIFGRELEYPLASLVCAAGFFTILLIEKVVVGGDEEVLAERAGGPMLLPYLLALVLSFHSFIAGVALGAEASVATSLALFIAVIAHKGVAAFALGVNLNRNAIVRSRSISIIAIFSTMTPLGIVSGAILAALLSGRTQQWFEATFDALAAGTFLYIAVIDIVEGEFLARKDLWIKFLMAIMGLAFMALVAAWT